MAVLTLALSHELCSPRLVCMICLYLDAMSMFSTDERKIQNKPDSGFLYLALGTSDHL